MIYKPTTEQLAVIDASDSALINAGPGTGKTRTAIEKARFKVRSLAGSSIQKVLFLSFSNAAVYRLSECAGVSFSTNEKRCLKFATYHTAAAEILKCYGRFVGLPHKTRIMDTLEQRMVWLEKGWATGNIDDEQLMGVAKSTGLLGFDALLPLATSLLRNSKELRSIYTRRFPLIIVDEFQDTSQDQWEFLRVLGNESQVVAFGDPDQIIYESLHKATENRMQEYRDWKQINDTRFSVDNFRCKRPEILSFAGALLNGRRHRNGDQAQVSLFKLAHRNMLRSALATIWMKIVKKAESNQTIGILAPTNQIAEQAAIDLRTPPPGAQVGFRVFARIPRDEAAIDSILLAVAALRDFAIWRTDDLCLKAVRAIFAMEFAWNPRRKKTPDLNKMQRRLMSGIDGDGTKVADLLASLRAGDSISSAIPAFLSAVNEGGQFATTYRRIKAHNNLNIVLPEKLNPQLSFFDELRAIRHPKGLDGYSASTGRTQILNYHKAKGREFDFVIMIVDPRGESKHVSVAERSRLYYVCATRAKEWLGIIYYGGDYGAVLGRVIAATG